METVLKLGDVMAFSWDEIEDLCIFDALNSRRRKLVNRWSRLPKLNPAALTDATCQNMFRFTHHDIQYLRQLLRIPDTIETPHRVSLAGDEALCITLRRLSYHNRLSDLQKQFALPSSVISSVINHIVNHICERFGSKLDDLKSHPWLTKEKVSEYATAILSKGVPLNNCWGFIDTTARRICRPNTDQKEYFSDHEHYYCLKYQAVSTPDGLMVNLQGPYHGSKNDAVMFYESGLLEQLDGFVRSESRKPYVLYSGSAYPELPFLRSPYDGDELTPQQAASNLKMSNVCQAVEWGFDKVTSLFSFIDYHKNQKIHLQNVSNIYRAATILTNAHTCLYGSLTASYFNVTPPHIKDYLETNLLP